MFVLVLQRLVWDQRLGVFRRRHRADASHQHVSVCVGSLDDIDGGKANLRQRSAVQALAIRWPKYLGSTCSGWPGLGNQKMVGVPRCSKYTFAGCRRSHRFMSFLVIVRKLAVVLPIYVCVGTRDTSRPS